MTLEEMKSKYLEYCNNIGSVRAEEMKATGKLSDIREKLDNGKIFDGSEINKLAKEEALLTGQAKALNNRVMAMQKEPFISFEEFTAGFNEKKEEHLKAIEPIVLKMKETKEELVTLLVQYQVARFKANGELTNMAKLAIDTHIAPDAGSERIPLDCVANGGSALNLESMPDYFKSITEKARHAGISMN